MSQINRLKDAGATVIQASPASLTIRNILDSFLPMIAPILAAERSKLQAHALGSLYRPMQLLDKLGITPMFMADLIRGGNLKHWEWLQLNEKRKQTQVLVERFFNDYDLLLTPVAPTTAPKHNNKAEPYLRSLEINGKKHAYLKQFSWVAMAHDLGLPATSIPVGLVDGLPANLQALGPRFSDRKLIAFAKTLEKELGGFKAPSDYEE